MQHNVSVDGEENPFTSYDMHVATIYYDSLSSELTKEVADQLSLKYRGMVGILLVNV